MKMFYRAVLILFILTQFSFSQNNKISGIIIGNKVLSNVTISIPSLELSTVSNENGEYSFVNVKNGKHQLIFTHLGYKKKTESIEFINDKIYKLDVQLKKSLIQLGEAEVISSKMEQTVKEISLPIEYISSTKLTNSPYNSLSELLNNESGLSVVKDGPWGTSVNVRGLGKQNLVYLIDGNRIETSTNIAAGLSLIDMNDLESIEVVKGGLSSLYGTGATGGVINIISKEAPLRDNMYITSQFISGFNSVNNSYSNYINLKAGDSNWSAKLTGSFRNADDTETPNGTLENSSFKDESLNASLKYVPFEDFTLDFNYQKFSAFDVGIPGGEPFPTSATAKYNYANRELFSLSFQYKNISKRLLKTSLKFYQQLIGRSVELKPNPLVTVNPKADHTTNGLLFQSDWYLSKNNFIIAGIDIWQREYEGIRKLTNIAKNIISVDKPIPNSKFRSFGLFAKDEINLINNTLNISLSGRYDFINITNEKTINPVSLIKNGMAVTPTPNEMASYDAFDENNKSVSGGLGLLYKLSNDYNLVFNFGYNFRSPSLEERYQYINLGSIVYLGNPKLKPEEALFFDAGLRIWKDRLSLKFNVFHNSFSNLVIDDVLVQDSVYIKKNVGEARLYGFDSRIDYNFYDENILYTSIAYTRGEDLTKNENLPQISPINGLVGIIVPIDNLLKVDLWASFTSDQDKIGLGEKRTGGFTYFNLALESETIKFGFANLKLVTGVQNIFDRKYREHLSTYRGFDNLEPGRNIFAKLIFEFE